MRIPASVLTETVQLQPSTGNTGDGETYGPAQGLRCNLDRTQQLLRTATGDTLTIAATMITAPEAPVAIRDRVVDGGDTYIVEKVVPVRVGRNVFALQVWLK